MTDNRTNEPTEAQVEAAALAMHRETGPRGGYGWTEYLSQARAALVAAQGAAPQAECDCGAGPGSAVCKKVCATRAPVLPSSTVIDPPLHPDEREPIALNPLLRGVDLALDRLIRRDCFSERTLRVIDELRDEITHQVLPSSGVDEDKLAEVIGRDENYTREIELGGWMLSPRLAARAVAAWLRVQGGESRGE